MFPFNNKPSGVVALIEQSYQLEPALALAQRLVAARDEKLILLVLSDSNETPAWFQIPAEYADSRIEVRVINNDRAGQLIKQTLREQPPVIFGCYLHANAAEKYTLSPLLQNLLHQIKCPLAIQKIPEHLDLSDHSPPRLLVPFSNDKNSRFAIQTALEINPNAKITVVAVAGQPNEDAERIALEREFQEMLKDWTSAPGVQAKLLYGNDPDALLSAEAETHNTVLIGSSRSHAFLRAIVGDTTALTLSNTVQQLLHSTDGQVTIVREYQGWLGSALARAFATGERLLPALSKAERIEVYRQVRRGARPRLDFFAMIGLSAAIAALGLQQNSPAVIIGAMLIAPLMSAIIGMGLAVVQGDLKFLAQSIRATLRGAGLALFMGVLIGLFDLDNSATREMLNRTGPALLDLIIAILSGAAAAYALCRKDVSAALPGVAIAVALVPPLATVGLFLSMTDWPHAGGALLLFITNLAAITFASGIVFTLFGFHPPYFQKKDVRRLKAFQKSFLAVSLLVLLVSTHLALLSVGEVAESYIENTVQTALTNYLAGYDKEITLLRWSLDDSNRKKPEVQLHLSSYVPLERERLIKLADQISLALGDPVRLSVTQLPATSVTSSNYFSSGPE